MDRKLVQGLALMVTALGILVLVGIPVNNLQANGLISKDQRMTCTAASDTCVLSVNVGCQYNASFCSLHNNIFFLNPCSTWTKIITLNYVGFISSFFSQCGATVTQSLYSFSQNNTFAGNVTFPGLVPVYGKHSIDITTGQAQWHSSQLPHPIQQGVTLPIYLTCLGWQTVGYTNVFGFPAGTEHQKSTAQCTFIDSSAGSLQIVQATNCWLFGNTTDINNAICTNFSPGANTFTDTGGSPLSFWNVGNIVSFALGLLGAGILIIIGIGIDVGAATISLGSNPQGSKLAQTFGMGLLIFMPLYSQFNTWFSNGYLPAGLDGDILNGQLGIVSVSIVVMFFLGAYSVSQSGTPSSS